MWKSAKKSLKSNMDRFIVVKYGDTDFKRKALKSNMDRFIGRAFLPNFCTECALKSNMDRFIVLRLPIHAQKWLL